MAGAGNRRVRSGLGFGVGIALVLGGQALAQGGVTWTQLSPANSPSPPRGGHAMAYDEARQQVVLFGGGDELGQFSDTWTWGGSNWTLRNPATSPVARWHHAMAYDAARQRVVMFGGIQLFGCNPFGCGAVRYSGTWEWDGSNWFDVTPSPPASSPQARDGHAMAYDAARQQVVMFGGFDGTTTLGDTWVWDGSNWMQLSPASSPPARSLQNMAYDAVRQCVVLFGGSTSFGGQWPSLSDTWEWDGVNWAQATPAQSPSARSFHAMAYEAARQRVVMFGGGVYPGLLSDTWEWDGVNWTRATPAQSPSERGTMVYDAASQRVVLFESFLAETWEYTSLSPASITSFGAGCPGSQGTPTLAAAPFSSLWTGDSFAIELANLPPGAMTFMVTGLSNTFWAGALIPLPAPLMSWGMPGCTVYTDVVDSELLVNTTGTATWSKVIPNDANLIGLTFYNQGFIIDPGVNAMGATVTNAGAATIGMR